MRAAGPDGVVHVHLGEASGPPLPSRFLPWPRNSARDRRLHGIGEATVLHLRELGFNPIAAVRKDEDAERLEGQGLRTTRIDVTDADRSRRHATRSATSRSRGW